MKMRILEGGVRILCAVAIRIWLRLYHRICIIGLENLPGEGSFVIVSNHGSHLDALCLLAALPLRKLGRAFPAAAADYFFCGATRRAAMRIILNALPFHRGGEVRESLRRCKGVLGEPGNVLILFPEGTRGKDGRLGAFRPGVGALLAGMDVPVVPCFIEGASGALPKGALFPRPRGIRLIIGRARSYSALARDRVSVRQIGHELRAAVRELNPGIGRNGERLWYNGWEGAWDS